MPAVSSKQAQSFPDFFPEWFAGIYDRLRVTAESFCRKVFSPDMDAKSGQPAS
jgi:hypothetical protein